MSTVRSAVPEPGLAAPKLRSSEGGSRRTGPRPFDLAQGRPERRRGTTSIPTAGRKPAKPPAAEPCDILPSMTNPDAPGGGDGRPAQAEETAAAPLDFIRDIIASDLRSGKHTTVATRFPPEPNGYLHIGHAKSICLNFGVANEFGGTCNLRFDDTNPTKEDVEYVDSIIDDVRWLGFDWADRLYYASDYFEQIYQYALGLIRDGKAYVDDLTAEEIREHRGTLTEPGRESPCRDRPVEENLDLFERMRKGEFADGAHVLRAKIDMASPNINLRDPVLYRIRHATHHRTGDAWCIYPMYDYTHAHLRRDRAHHALALHARVRGPPPALRLDRRQPAGAEQAAADRVRAPEPHLHGDEQAQAAAARAGRARLGLGRPAHADARRPAAPRLHARVDPRVRRAHRRRQAREHGGRRAARGRRPRRPQHGARAAPWPSSARSASSSRTTRRARSRRSRSRSTPRTRRWARAPVPFSRVLYIEQDDFREVPPPKYFRLSPGREVRLRGTYFLKCERVVKDDAGRGGRAALHLRPRDARRVLAGRPEGEGDDPLGVGRARGRRRGPALRPAVHGARPPRRRGRARLEVVSQPAVAGGPPGLQARAGPASIRRR